MSTLDRLLTVGAKLKMPPKLWYGHLPAKNNDGVDHSDIPENNQKNAEYLENKPQLFWVASPEA